MIVKYDGATKSTTIELSDKEADRLFNIVDDLVEKIPELESDELGPYISKIIDKIS